MPALVQPAVPDIKCGEGEYDKEKELVCTNKKKKHRSSKGRAAPTETSICTRT